MQPTDPAWSALEQAAASVPVVAVLDDRNVLAGVWEQLASVGVRVFGYVFSGSGQQPLDEVKSEVTDWFTRFPDLTGMFVDVGPPLDSNNPEQHEPANVRSWYQDLYAHVISQAPAGRSTVDRPQLMLNCGGLRDQDFAANCLDFAVWEQDYPTYVNDAWWMAATGQGGEWWIDAGSMGKQVVHVVQSVPQGDQAAMQRAIALAQSRGADFAYVYDGTSTAYDRLPTFWDAEVPALAAAMSDGDQGGTVIARPQAPAPAWRVHGAADAATALARALRQPDPVDATSYVWGGGTVGALLEVSVGAPPTAIDRSASATTWFYANTGAETTLLTEVVGEGQVLGSLSVEPGAGFAWRRISVNQADLPTGQLYLRFTVLDAADSNVRAAYVEFQTLQNGGDRWRRTWYAPCSQLSEFTGIEVPKDTTDRLMIIPVQPARSGTALRVQVRDGDWAWNPYANGGQGGIIPGGWRAEVKGPFESRTDRPVRYTWSTMLAPDYVADPRTADGKRTWQVITQWHQGDNDRGNVPPIAFILLGEQIWLDLHRWNPNDETTSIQVGQWPVAELQRGEWHQFQAEIRWDVSEGTLELRHDGQPVTFNPQVPPDAPGEPEYPPHPTTVLTGLATLFEHQSGQPGEPQSYLKAGLYRKAATTTPDGPYVLFHDELSREEQSSSASALGQTHPEPGLRDRR